MAEAQREHIVYGDRTLRIVWQGDRVFWDRVDDDGDPECLLGISKAQMDEVCRGWQREREQERDGRP